jgi:hypothetical protein
MVSTQNLKQHVLIARVKDIGRKQKERIAKAELSQMLWSLILL